MKIKVKKTDVYIPEWNGNKNDSDPIAVHYRFLSESDRGRYISIEPIKVSGSGDPEVTIKQDNQGLTIAMVTRIDNLEMEMNGNTDRIDDAKKLYSHAGVPTSLVKEIEGAMAAASAVIDSTPLESPTTSTD